MPNVNWNEVEEPTDNKFVPNGWYECQVINIKPKKTQAGDDMFGLKFSITRGEHKNKHFYDNIVFSKTALPRAKHICKAMGINVSGNVEINQNTFKGRSCICELENDGKYNNVTYLGYKPVESTPF